MNQHGRRASFPMAPWGASARATRRRLRIATIGLLIASMFVSACTFGSEEPPPSQNSTSQSPQPGTAEPPEPGSAALAGVKLSAGQAQSVAEPVEVVTGEPLVESEYQTVVDRLPAWDPASAQTEPFQWPAQTIKPPLVGETIESSFPATGSDPMAEPTDIPLEVLRIQPEGDVELAPFITITFNQPMVPVATVGQLAELAAPATISPELPGSWQWMGTSTLRFDYDASAEAIPFDRLPMATEYTITVPAGTVSASGAKLAAEVTSTFATPAASVVNLTPTGSSLALSPIFVAAFDQQIDAQAVLDHLTVTAGEESWEMRLATEEEIAADDDANSAVQNLEPGRWLAFRPVEPFVADTAVNIEFPVGTPSAEGALTALTAQKFSGRTYPALTITDSGCAYSDCYPGSPLQIGFSNELDPELFDPAAVTVSPEIPGSVTVVTGDALLINGATQASTEYTVTVPAGLTDTFGQQLGSDQARTISIGSEGKRLYGFQQPLTTLDPLAPNPAITIDTVNRLQFRERVFAVGVTDWEEYQKFLMDGMNVDPSSGDPIDVPDWPVLVDQVVDVAQNPDRVVNTTLDLTEALGGKPGHVVILIEPTAAESFSDDEWWRNQPTVTWAQSTTIGIDALSDATSLRVWTTDLRDGTPLEAVAVVGAGTTATSTTDADGVALLPLTSSRISTIQVTSGDQTALLSQGWFDSGWTAQPSQDEVRWLVNDDRQTYRPGETVSIKGWVREHGSTVGAQLTLADDGSTVTWTASDGQGIEIASGDADLSGLGGFDFTFELPDGASLGGGSINFELSGSEYSGYQHYFQIADFRRPEFEVTARTDSQGPYVLGTPLTLAADVNYYAGGPLAATPVQWQVQTAEASYTPPGRDDYTFGVWTPWWISGAFDYYGAGAGDYGFPCCGEYDATNAQVEEFAGTTDANGSNYLQVEVGDLGAEFAGLPVTVTSQAAATDVNRQTLAGSTSVLVHPGELYVGLKGDATFVKQGEPLVVNAIVTDIDGKAAAGKAFEVRAALVTSTWSNGELVETEADPQICPVTSAADPVPCTFNPTVGGTYKVTATVTDDESRSSRTELTRWVSGTDAAQSRTVDQEELTLVPDKEDYLAGDTAQVLVQSPITEGSGLMTLVRGGIVSTEKFVVSNGSAILPVPLAQADLPGVSLSIEVVGASPRAAADGNPAPEGQLRPAFATGSIDLAMSTKSRELVVTATPSQDALTPGSDTQVDVSVKDQAGNPVVGSEFEVIVVDEAVLALSDYSLPDPLEIFYSRIGGAFDTFYGRSNIRLSDVPVPGEAVPAAGSGVAESAAATSAAAAPEAPTAAEDSSSAGGSDAYAGRTTVGAPIPVRDNFDALVTFQPEVITDESGEATIELTLPDNLTRYRVMVVAVAGADRFGTAEANITARLPLSVRPSAPRFLNYGDSVELPVLVQNQTDAELTVDVVLQTSNLTVTSDPGQRVVVPANDRVEVRFPVNADLAGQASFRVAVVSGDSSDAAVVDLPVYTPSTSESFATYGVVDGPLDVAQPILAPTDAIAQFGGLTVSTSSTALQELTDSVLYLNDYPYESSDGLSSQIIAIASLGEVLDAFDVPGALSADDLRAGMVNKIDKLVALQNEDGGFAYWQRGDTSSAFNSIQATQALTLAASKDFAVPADALARAQSFLADIELHFPDGADQSTRDTLKAYALNVLSLGGQPDAAAAKSLVDARGGELSLDALAWLWPVLSDPTAIATVAERVNNAAVDTAGAVTFTNSVTDSQYLTLQSDTRSNALVLDALISVSPKSDLIPKIVNGLLGGRTQGRWATAQDNSFSLLALKHYFDTYENAAPNFTSRVWVGEQFAGEQAFVGYSTDRSSVTVPTSELVTIGDAAVTVGNDGTGRLYYRIGLQTSPTNLQLDPLDRGFVVSRTYEAVDDPGDVSQDADGTWHVKAGATVRVRVSMVAQSPRNQMALIDPLPAGLEILNAELATTPQDLTGQDLDGNDPVATSFWRWSWFDHQNLRDHRAEAFAGYLPAGVYDYTYLATATTIGNYVVPPPRAEEIYAPETFGRGGTDRVVIDG